VWYRSGSRIRNPITSVADPHHVDADPDPIPPCHFDADPDPAFQLDTDPHLDPDPTVHFDADPDPGPCFQIRAQNLKKRSNRPILKLLRIRIQFITLMRIQILPVILVRIHPDPDSDHCLLATECLISQCSVKLRFSFFLYLHRLQVDLTNKNVSIAVVGKDKDFTMYDDADVDQFLSGIEGEERRRGQR
jgi:hypothetical protein